MVNCGRFLTLLKRTLATDTYEIMREGIFEPPKAYAIGPQSRSVVLDVKNSELLESRFMNLNRGQIVFNLNFFFGCMV